MPQMDREEKKRKYRKLLWLFSLTFLLSNGPGLYLVNFPILWAGFPLLYLWGFFGAVAQIWIIIYGYLKLWRNEPDVDIVPLQDEAVAGKGAAR